MFIVFFFFSSRRRHTRLTCDWSSDVCSSDLVGVVVAGEVVGTQVAVVGPVVQDVPDDHDEVVGDRDGGLAPALLAEPAVQTTKAGTQVGVGPASGPGGLHERLAQL